jgi:hypothetical protein
VGAGGVLQVVVPSSVVVAGKFSGISLDTDGNVRGAAYHRRLSRRVANLGGIAASCGKCR